MSPECVARRQGGELHAAVSEECVASHEQGIGALARKGGKGRIDLADRAGVDLDLQSEGGSGFLHVPQRGFGARGIGRIDEYGNDERPSVLVMQELQPLGNLPLEKIDARHIAAGPGEAGDKTKADRVGGDAEDDRDGRGRRLGRERAGTLPGVTITATRRRTRSAASAGSRSYWPSSQRYSTVTFWPST